MISNRAKSISFHAAKDRDYKESKHFDIRGQIYCTALILKIDKFANKKYQKRGGKK